MRYFKVKCLAVSGVNNRVYRSGDIVPETGFVTGSADKYVTSKHIEEVAEADVPADKRVSGSAATPAHIVVTAGFAVDSNVITAKIGDKETPGGGSNATATNDNPVVIPFTYTAPVINAEDSEAVKAAKEAVLNADAALTDAKAKRAELPEGSHHMKVKAADNAVTQAEENLKAACTALTEVETAEASK